jgi:hypothetical protein
MTNIKGGNGGNGGASEFGSYVWGGPAEQQSISPETNIIAVANDPVAYKGGMKSNTGGDLTTLAVPAVLVAANHLYNPKRKSFRKSSNKSFRKSYNKFFRNSRSRGRGQRRPFFKGGEGLPELPTNGGEGQINNLLAKSDNLMNMISPTTMPSVVYNTTNMTPPQPNVPVYTGGNVKQTGAGILTDIAVPAVLLTANHLYRRSKKYGKSRKNKRSRRVSFRKQSFRKQNRK